MPVINKLETLLNESINLEQKNIINHKFNSLKIKNISFSYGKNNILKNINIEFPNSGIVLINGSSGSGKTTLMNIIMGLLKIESGEIFYNNKKITYPYIIKELAYVPQNTFIFDDTIKSNIILNRVYDENKFKKILEICKLEELNNKFDIYKNAIGSGQTSLSGGQKQRVSLARAIYGEPSIIVLDEPFSSLDVSNFNDIINNIKKIKDKFNCLFILVSHVTIPKEILDAEYIVNNGYITKTK